MITSADAVLTMSVPQVLNAPTQIQGFSAESIYDTEMLKSVETSMGIDGTLTGGFQFKEVVQKYMLQADSKSIDAFFDQWWAFMQANNTVYVAFGSILLPSLGKNFTLEKGFLTGYQPLPNAKKLLEPQNFEITWQRIIPAKVAG